MTLHKCPHCKEKVTLNHFACVANAKGGSVTSEAKREAAKLNGAKAHKWKTCRCATCRKRRYDLKHKPRK